MLHPCDVNYCKVINVNHVFLLDPGSMCARQSQINCQFHVRKVRILLICPWVNDFRKKYQQKYYDMIYWELWLHVCFSFYKKTPCFDGNLMCFLSLYVSRSCLVLAVYNITNIPCLFCLISKLFTLGNIIFNSALHRWILITSGD